MNNANVFLVSSTELFIVLNIVLFSFKQGIVEVPYKYLWRILVACFEHCGDVHLDNVELPIKLFCDKIKIIDYVKGEYIYMNKKRVIIHIIVPKIPHSVPKG